MSGCGRGSRDRPIVESFTYTLPRNLVACDVATCDKTVIEPERLPTMTSVGHDFIYGNKPLTHSNLITEDQDREEFWNSMHLQQIEFAIARELVGRLTAAAGYEDHEDGRLKLQARRDLFPQVRGIVRQYIATRVDFRGWRQEELALETYTKRVVELLQAAIQPVDSEGQTTLLPLLNRWKPIGTTAEVNFKTKRPCYPTKRSHIDQVVLDTGTWEQSAAFYLEASQHVACYARNDQMGLAIPYTADDDDHAYMPDFLVRLNDPWQSVLVLEIKGRRNRRGRSSTPRRRVAARRHMQC